MFYRAINKFTNEVWESEEFKDVYRASLHAAKIDLHYDSDRLFTSVRFTSVETAVDMVDEKTGNIYTCYIGQKYIGYMMVGREEIVVAMFDQGVWETKRGQE